MPSAVHTFLVSIADAKNGSRAVRVQALLDISCLLILAASVSWEGS
jgi:hypothetical protein